MKAAATAAVAFPAAAQAMAGATTARFNMDGPVSQQSFNDTDHCADSGQQRPAMDFATTDGRVHSANIVDVLRAHGPANEAQLWCCERPHADVGM